MKLYPFQKEFLDDKSRFRLAVKSRQIGMSTAIALEMITDALQHPGHLALCVSASERQAREVLDKCYAHIRPLKPRFKEETKTSFVLANGSHVISLPNNASTVRGYRADAVYLDEFAHFQDDAAMLTAILPSVSRGGRLTVISTPLGKRGEFWRLYNDDDFSKHEFDCSCCPDLDIEPIEATMDAVSFSQEYKCCFVEEAVSFFPYDLILSCVDDSLEDFSVYERSSPVYIGVDFGRIIDSTVIIAVEKGTPSRVLCIKEMLGVPFEKQMEELSELARSLKASRVSVDRTGYGIPLEEQAQGKLGSRVEGVDFTTATKENMATALRVAFENTQSGRLDQGSILIPRNDKLIRQLHSLERSITPGGTVRYRHTSGAHDDYVWALCLAYQGTTTLHPSIDDIQVSTKRYDTYDELGAPIRVLTDLGDY